MGYYGCDYCASQLGKDKTKLMNFGELHFCTLDCAEAFKKLKWREAKDVPEFQGDSPA